MASRVLIVDDSLTVRMDLSEEFTAAGFAIVACATAEEAKAALAESLFDLIVLDVILPTSDGVELLREIRESPRTAGAAVILLSSRAQVSDRIHGMGAGADEYVGKPYESSYLIARAQQLVRSRSTPSGPALILVIDDSITFRAHMKQALEDAGYDVVVAVSGENGLRKAADIRPAAIVVDYGLPGIDGVSVVRRLRMDEALRRIPCLLLTASQDKAAEIVALESGVDAFVCKFEGSDVVLARLTAMLRNAGEATSTTAPSLMDPKKILAVDDDELYLRKIMSDLKRERYEVVPASSGDEALEFLKSEAVDCILLDAVMPGKDGFETCQMIKSNPATRHYPVVMISTLLDKSFIAQSLDAGADDYVSKCGEFDVLRARLLAQIRRKGFEDKNRRRPVSQ